MAYMFYGCNAVTELDVSSFDTSEITSMFGLFWGCSGLSKLDLNSFDTSKVTMMSYMFEGCTNLENLDLSGFDTSNVENMARMFKDCSSLEWINMKNFSTESFNPAAVSGYLYALYNAFDGCTALQSIMISPEMIIYEDSGINNCANLSRIGLAGSWSDATAATVSTILPQNGRTLYWMPDATSKENLFTPEPIQLNTGTMSVNICGQKYHYSPGSGYTGTLSTNDTDSIKTDEEIDITVGVTPEQSSLTVYGTQFALNYDTDKYELLRSDLDSEQYTDDNGSIKVKKFLSEVTYGTDNIELASFTFKAKGQKTDEVDSSFTVNSMKVAPSYTYSTDFTDAVAANVISGTINSYENECIRWNDGLAERLNIPLSADRTFNYDGQEHTVAQITVNPVQDSDVTVMYGTEKGNYKYDTAIVTASNAGNYTQYFYATKPGYYPVEDSYDLIINKVPLTITWNRRNETSFRYNGSEITGPKGIVSGFVNNEEGTGSDKKWSLSGNTGKEIGHYTAEITFKNGDWQRNYVIPTDLTREWSIVKGSGGGGGNVPIPVDPADQLNLSESTCPRDATCPIEPFADTLNDFWWHDGVHFCIENKLMKGISSTEFIPNGNTTRAMAVTIIWRMAGSPSSDYAMTFTDVPSNQWYSEAVRWAQSAELVQGYSKETFSPGDCITREQMAVIIRRNAEYLGIDVNSTNMTASFTDEGEVSDWALPAIKWANNVGLIQGKTTTALMPLAYITRAETATIIQRYCSIL